MKLDQLEGCHHALDIKVEGMRVKQMANYTNITENKQAVEALEGEVREMQIMTAKQTATWSAIGASIPVILFIIGWTIKILMGA